MMIYKFRQEFNSQPGQRQEGFIMKKVSAFVPYLKGICILILLSFCIQSSSADSTNIVTLQWDASIDAPYLASYRIYYSTTSGAPDAPTSDYAKNYSLDGGVTWVYPSDQNVTSPITIPSSNLQVTLKFVDNSVHYFALKSVDTRGLESVFSNEVFSNPVPEITVLKVNGASGTTVVYTNNASRLVQVGIVASDVAPGTVDQYLILDDRSPTFDSNPNNGIFTLFPAGPRQTQDTQTLTLPFALYNADGLHNIYVWVKDNDRGISSSPFIKYNIYLDRALPAPPAALDLVAADDTGISNSDNITNKTTGLTFTGTGEELATVQLYDGAAAIGATAAVSGGAFSISGINLTEGIHTITAKQRDLAGNTSLASGSLIITVDATGPRVSGARMTDLTHVDVFFSEAVNDGATLARYALSGGIALSSVQSQGANTYRLTTTSAMSVTEAYTVTVNTMTDVAGNAMLPANAAAQFSAFRITVDSPAAPFYTAGSVNLLTSGTPRTATFSGTAGTSGRYRWSLSGVGSINSTTADTIIYTAPATISGTTQRDTLTLTDADNPTLLTNSIDINIYNPLAVTLPGSYVAGQPSTYPLLATGGAVAYNVSATGGLPGNFDWSIIDDRSGSTLVGPVGGGATYGVDIDSLFDNWGAGVYTIKAQDASATSEIKIRLPLRIAPLTGVYNDTDPDQNFTVTGHHAPYNITWAATDVAGTVLGSPAFVSFASGTATNPGINAFDFNAITQLTTFRVQAQSVDVALAAAGLDKVITGAQIIKPTLDFRVQVNNSSTGAGIPGAVVTATFDTGKTGTTDSTGRATITSMENTGVTYTFSVTAAGYGPITFTASDLSLIKTVTMVAIPVDTQGTISGTVRLFGVPGGTGITVSLNGSVQPRPQVIADVNTGAYSLTFDTAVEIAPYTVSAGKTGYVTNIADDAGVVGAALGQTDANINLPRVTVITITNDAGSPTLTYSITATPAFTNTAGEIQIFAGTGAVGNNLAAGATFTGGTYTYSVSTPAALQASSIFVRADTSTAGRNASSGYYATATNIFVSPAPGAPPTVPVTVTEIVATPNDGGTATAASTSQPGQAGEVYLPPGGVDTLESVTLEISDAPPVTITTGSSLIYVTSLAFTEGGAQLPGNLINQVYFTISFDPARVPSGSLESGAMAILLAPDLAAMAAGTVTSVPTSQIMSVNYATGEVTFWVNSLPVVGVGAATTNEASGDGGGGGCFIATAAFGSNMENHVRILSLFRDQYLIPTHMGKKIVDFYYRHSPPIADYLRKHPVAKTAMRYALIPVTGVAYVAMKVHPAIFLIALIFMLVGIVLAGCLICYRRRFAGGAH